MTRLSRSSLSRHSLRALGPAVLVGAIAIAGCGASSAAPAPAPSSSASGGTSAFRQCLEQHGVKLPTDRPAGGTHHAPPAGSASSGFRKAIQACGGAPGNGGPFSGG